MKRLGSIRQYFRPTFQFSLRRGFTTDQGTPLPPYKHLLHPSLFHPSIKQWQIEAPLQPSQLVYPIFVSDQPDEKEEIKALPGQYRWGIDRLDELIAPLVSNGLSSVLIFGVLKNKEHKDGNGNFADDDGSPVMKALHRLSAKYPSLYLAADVCLCGYTDHGHCGILKSDGNIDNPPSIKRLSEIAAAYAEAGAHCVAPSDMMDGRVAAIKYELRKDGRDGNVSVMSYAAKFASVYYGPFREAASSGMSFGDRTKYQLDVSARKLALRAIQRDVEEGADIIMVKPGALYLDVVREAKNMTNLPIAIYQVSGEYAMLYHGAKAGAFPLRGAVMESLVSARRAGSDILITYFAPQVLEWLREEGQVNVRGIPKQPPKEESKTAST